MVIISDYLVIGTGVAGLSFALKAARTGTVNVICKRGLADTNTNLAQGGIAAVLGDDDQVEYHIRDTLDSGVGLSKYATVKAVVEAGPRVVRELAELGVPFTARVDHPEWPELGQEGGHSHRRIVHAQDMTGAVIQKALIEKARSEPNLHIYERSQALDLVIDDETGSRTVLGAYVLDIDQARVVTFGAKVVILATGGSGKVYLYTTNPDGATGDGLAMGVRAGARAANMEFIQFHPTCLYHPKVKNFLISEAVRGEGAHLVDKNGGPFMKKYHNLGDLAYRDVVARAIDAEMKKSGDECVFLDISHKPVDFVRGRFPSIHARLLSLGLDMTREPIPVAPAAHFQCGGLLVDLDGRTDIRGLYAVGEVAATGLHGANRLASNSLLEGLVMADRSFLAARAEVEFGLTPDPIRIDGAPTWSVARLGHVPRETMVIAKSWDEIRRFMWNYVGIIRTDYRLKMAAARLALVKTEIDDFFQKNEVDANLIEVRNIAQVADLIIRCAGLRRESRGLNYNLDWPERDDQNFKHDTVLSG
ncbi:MAG: L-aspartate oxidase [Candidatus Adiutrix intracellularis]|jgi:L-aspartate oxidase|nr:MAG: L-aspartate oxidase [Candidatus Adiutrix intracellularis]MDR2826447.1 L-aspartate oxidase [Candidatus Adiutrix intracellularis]